MIFDIIYIYNLYLSIIINILIMKIINTALKITTFLLIIFFILLLFISIYGDKNSTYTSTSPLIGRKIPDHELSLFNGSTINLNTLKGKILVINFWASWCSPCKEEAPAIESSWTKYRSKGVEFIGINIMDDKNSAIKYLTEIESSYINAIDKDGKLAVDFGISGVPETLFVDPNGIIVDKYIGPLTEDLIDKFISKIGT